MKIHVNSPCQIDIDKQPVSKSGWNCAFCQKEVVDFRAYSQQQLLGYFSTHTAKKLCGRFHVHQLAAHPPKSILVASGQDDQSKQSEGDEDFTIGEDPEETELNPWEEELVGGDVWIEPGDGRIEPFEHIPPTEAESIPPGDHEGWDDEGDLLI